MLRMGRQLMSDPVVGQSWLDRVVSRIVTTVQRVSAAIVEWVQGAARSIKAWVKSWIGD